jgi:hypothetical protein
MARLTLPVPFFSPRDLILAELCATDLWRGVNFSTGKNLKRSDEQFLIDFALPFNHLVNNSNINNQITEDSIKCLVSVAKLTNIYRLTNSTDFQYGIHSMSNNILPIYFNCQANLLNPNPSPLYEYGTNAILQLGRDFVNNPKKPSKYGNYRIALASRILFFTIPNMLLFNFSSGLAKNMLFKSSPQNEIGGFNEALSNGLQLNTGLHSMSLPAPIWMNISLYEQIQNTDWWQRRVLDLALLQHFNKKIVIRYELKLQANRLMRNIATTP